MVSLVEPPLTFIAHAEQCRASGFSDESVILSSYKLYSDAYSRWLDNGGPSLYVDGGFRTVVGDNCAVGGGSDTVSSVSLRSPVGWIEGRSGVVDCSDPMAGVVTSRLSSIPSFLPVMTEVTTLEREQSALCRHRELVRDPRVGSLYKVVSTNVLRNGRHVTPWFLVGACQLPTVLSHVANVPSPRKLAYRMQLAACSGYDAECVDRSYYAGLRVSPGRTTVGVVFHPGFGTEENALDLWISSVGATVRVISVFMPGSDTYVMAKAIFVSSAGVPFTFSDFLDSACFSDYQIPMDERVIELRARVAATGLALPCEEVEEVVPDSDSDQPTNMDVQYASKRYLRRRIATLSRAKRLVGLSEEDADGKLYGSVVNAEFADGRLPIARITAALHGTHRAVPTASMKHLVASFNASSSSTFLVMESEARMFGAHKREGKWYSRRYRPRIPRTAQQLPALVDSGGMSLTMQYCVALFNTVSRGTYKYVLVHNIL